MQDDSQPPAQPPVQPPPVTPPPEQPPSVQPQQPQPQPTPQPPAPQPVQAPPQQAVPPPQAQPPAFQPGPTQPPATPAVAGGVVPPPSSVPLNAKRSPLKLVAVVAAAILLIGAGAAYYFAVYLPNTPENVYRRGMASVGVGLEELIEKDMLPTSEATEFSGQLNMSSPTVVSANFDGSAAIGGDGKFAVDVAWEGYNPKLELLYFILAPQYPQIFFKVDGIQEVVDGYLGPGSFQEVTNGEEYENIWWLIDYKDLIDQGLITESELQEALDTNSQEATITTEDYIAMTQAVIQASNDYLFTSETNDMVLERTADLGSEEYEGVMSNKYAVSVNRENLKKYLKAIRNNVIATGVPEKINSDFDFAAEITDSDIDSWVDEMDLSDVDIEAWVSLDNKVLRNIRFVPTGDDEGSSHVDVSLLLDGTNLDRIPLRLQFVGNDETSEGTVTVNWLTDINANTTEFTVSTNVQDKINPASSVVFDATVSAKGLPTAPIYEVPTPSQSLIDKFFDSANNLQQVLGETIEQF